MLACEVITVLLVALFGDVNVIIVAVYQPQL